MKIIPIQPATKDRPVDTTTTTGQPSLIAEQSRRTFGRRIPSRRTFGRRVPSRRSF